MTQDYLDHIERPREDVRENDEDREHFGIAEIVATLQAQQQHHG